MGTADTLRQGDRIAARYRIVSLLGAGGMGAVYVAEHEVTGRRVALKIIQPELADEPEAVARFMREARVVGSIDHPNVVTVFDAGTYANMPFIAMELLRGETLREAIDRRPLVPDDAVRKLLPAMRGVGAAHELGVIHRDLKPENVFLVAPKGGVELGAKVLDFGISKLTDAPQGVARGLTQTGTVLGTPHYMSPEQLTDAAGADARADVYAMGVILFEALTGALPFDADNYNKLIIQIMSAAPRQLRGLASWVPPSLETIVARAMARNANDRYSTMRGLIATLEEWLEERTSLGHDSTMTADRGPIDAALAATRLTPVSHSTDAATESAERARPSMPTSTPMTTEMSSTSMLRTTIPGRGRSIAVLGAMLLAIAVGAAVTIATFGANDHPEVESPSRVAQPRAAAQPAREPVELPAGLEAPPPSATEPDAGHRAHRVEQAPRAGPTQRRSAREPGEGRRRPSGPARMAVSPPTTVASASAMTSASATSAEPTSSMTTPSPTRMSVRRPEDVELSADEFF